MDKLRYGTTWLFSFDIDAPQVRFPNSLWRFFRRVNKQIMIMALRSVRSTQLNDFADVNFAAESSIKDLRQFRGPELLNMG